MRLCVNLCISCVIIVMFFNSAFLFFWGFLFFLFSVIVIYFSFVFLLVILLNTYVNKAVMFSGLSMVLNNSMVLKNLNF